MGYIETIIQWLKWIIEMGIAKIKISIPIPNEYETLYEIIKIYSDEFIALVFVLIIIVLLIIKKIK